MVTLHPTRLRSRHLTDSMSGHTWWWQHEGLGDVEKRFLEEHGTVVRWNGALGVRSIPRGPAMGYCDADAITQEERLWIADPKAIHHILQDSCYQYEKPPHTRGKRELLVGKGISWVEGESPLASRE